MAKEFVKTHPKNLQLMYEHLGTYTKVGEILGVSDSSISHWLRAGACPVPVEYAAQHFLSKQEKEGGKEKVFLIWVSPRHLEAVTIFLDAIGVHKTEVETDR